MKKQISGALAVLMAVLFVALAAHDYGHFPYSDGPEQGAAVRALADSLMEPGDPIVNENVPSSRYVPSTVFMALFLKISGIDIIVTLKIFTCVFFVFFLFSAYLFSTAYFDDRRMPLLCIASLLFLWGTGWKGSNAYMFSALAYNAYFSSVVAFSLSLLALYFQLSFLKGGFWKHFVAGALVGSLAFVNHPLTGFFFLISSFFIFIEHRGLTAKAVLLFLCFTVPVPALMAFWPYYDFFSPFRSVASGGMSPNADFMMSWTYLHSQPLIRLGPALVGIPLLALLARERRHVFLTGGFIAFSAIYLVGYLARFPLSERFIFFVAFVLQLTAAFFFRQLLDSSKSSGKVGAWLMMLLFAAGAVCQSVLVYQQFILPAWNVPDGALLPHYESPNIIQEEWRRYFKKGDIVLSDICTSWAIPVYTGAKIVAPWQTSPHVISTPERVRDVNLFYNQKTDAEKRRDILKKYHVSHILIHYAIDGKDIEPAIRHLDVTEVARTPAYSIFKCNR